MPRPWLLLGGGLLDPNLQALAEAADAAGVGLIDLRTPPGHSPVFHWDLDTLADALPWGGAAWPTGAFLRHDVFGTQADPRPAVHERAQGWQAAVQGWLLAHPQVRTCNADMAPEALYKVAAQVAARQAGLPTPATWLSNDVARLRERQARGPAIAKPVAGGGLCQTLDHALLAVAPDTACSAMPALVQPRLVAPELRVFVIGRHTLAFRVDSPSLDYRAEQDATVTPCDVPPEAQALRRLMQRFRMDFGAADFKTDPATGALCFLELNTSPMFVHFDQVSEGAVCRALLDHLLGEPAPHLLEGGGTPLPGFSGANPQDRP